jgi:hypothetical protein
MTYQISFKPVLRLLLLVLLTFAVYSTVKTMRINHFTYRFAQTKDKSLDGLRDSVWTPAP